MEKASLLCVNCGLAPPAHRRTWDRCTRCAELNLPSTYYCGEECMKAHWPKHKVWHMLQKELVEQLREETMILDHDRSLAEAAARRAELTGDEFQKRVAAALALGVKGDLHAEAKAWRKIIWMRPDVPSPYHNLGLVLLRSGRCADAAPMFIKAVELAEDGTNAWASSAAEAYNVLAHEDCDDDTVSKPQWWNDEGLKALSARVVAITPDDYGACSFRACVLSGCAVVENHTWDVGPRTAAEIKEAVTWFHRAARTVGTSAMKLRFEDYARRCDKVASPLLAEEEAEAAKARAAAEVAAADALAAAEAKAKVAADELLAEEEKEKTQTASNTASKAKQGKGKKGKGKR